MYEAVRVLVSEAYMYVYIYIYTSIYIFVAQHALDEPLLCFLILLNASIYVPSCYNIRGHSQVAGNLAYMCTPVYMPATIVYMCTDTTISVGTVK